MSEDNKLGELTYKFEDLIKSIKYFSTWKAKETLEKAKKICDKQKQELISEFVKDLKQITWLIGKAPCDMGFYIKKWEEKLK